jgi:four helix bundle protein
MEKQGFKSLLVWQKSYELAIKIYKVTERSPKSEIYGLVSQMRRAAISVPANIAEGYERQYNKEYIQFLTIARGSLGELETYLLLAKDLNYITEGTFGKLEQSRKEVIRLLQGLIRSQVKQ